MCARNGVVEPADEVRLVRPARTDLLRLDGEDGLAADDGEVGRVGCRAFGAGRRHVVDRRPSPTVPARTWKPPPKSSTPIAWMNEPFDADAGHEREDDEREHRERRAGAEAGRQRVGDRHPQDRREALGCARGPA